MGIMLLVFVPIPYVDATSSYSFRDKKKRMLVGAAGILVELFLAALAVVVWVNAGPGTVRAIAYNMMIIGGVSTLLMNGNPLIRYDAYYILSDFLEIPNLAARSSEYLGYFVKRRLLCISEVESTARTAGEACWLAFYGVASFVYRIFIMTAITLFIAGKFFVAGILIALWTLFSFIVLPLKETYPAFAVRFPDAALQGTQPAGRRDRFCSCTGCRHRCADSLVHCGRRDSLGADRVAGHMPVRTVLWPGSWLPLIPWCTAGIRLSCAKPGNWTKR